MRKLFTFLLHWTPRGLGLLFAVFISVFALDVFDGQHGFWQTAMALLLHLIPTFMVLAVVALSWRWQWVGAVVFPFLGLLYLLQFWGRFPWSVYALIAGPLFLLGILFGLDWRQQRATRAHT